MSRTISRFLAVACCWLLLPAMAQETGQQKEGQQPSANAPAAEGTQEPQEPTRPLAERLANFSPRTGAVTLRSLAEVKLADGWLWLDGEGGRKFLRELGNQPGSSTLGVALPPDFDDSGVFAVYSYSDEGHVKDDEAPDYDQLLRDMKESARQQSKARQQAKLSSVDLLGWAEPPHYDKAQRKLYWAEKLKFGDEEELVLNYNVRVLGRTGHLVVNGVGGIDQLEQVAAHSKTLLGVTEFLPGQRYEDFDPAYDKVAAYGIGGLIAGKLAAKAGLFAKLALLLKGFAKPILIGLVVVVGGLWKLLTGRRRQRAEAEA
jgi:uncharacterized membrane-anchored protein